MTDIPSNDVPTLRTRRLVIRPVVAADAHDFFEIHADPQAMRYWSTPAWTDPAQAARIIESDRIELEAGRSFRYAVLETATATMIGCCSLFRIDRVQGCAEIGYILRRSHWGRGLMSEAMGAVVEFAFTTLALRRLEADIDPRNDGSMAMVRRLGFRQEALMRQRWTVDGEVSDSAICGLLRHDWAGAASRPDDQIDAKRSATLPSAL